MNDTKQESFPLVTWLILVYDSKAENRFPLQRKWYRFSYERATRDETNAVLRMLRVDDRLTPKRPDIMPGQMSIMMSLSSAERNTSPKIRQYRHLFDPVKEDDLAADPHQVHGFVSVMLEPDSYFEDEDGKFLSLVEINDREARRSGDANSFAITLGHPESLLRLGPLDPVRVELWSKKDADLLAQFFSTYRFLVGSRWLRSRCEITPSKNGVRESTLPVHEDCMSVILPFRQLYSSDGMDNLFTRSCEIHNRHCQKETPHGWWVSHYKKAFNSYLGSTANLPWLKPAIPVRRYLDAFAYGAGIIHATSKTSTPESDLGALLSENAREFVVMGYHFILRTLLGYVSQAECVIRQNVQHWTRQLGWPQSTRLAAQDLFGPTPSPDADQGPT